MEGVKNKLAAVLWIATAVYTILFVLDALMTRTGHVFDGAYGKVMFGVAMLEHFLPSGGLLFGLASIVELLGRSKRG